MAAAAAASVAGRDQPVEGIIAVFSPNTIHISNYYDATAAVLDRLMASIGASEGLRSAVFGLDRGVGFWIWMRRGGSGSSLAVLGEVEVRYRSKGVH